MLPRGAPTLAFPGRCKIPVPVAVGRAAPPRTGEAGTGGSARLLTRLAAAGLNRLRWAWSRDVRITAHFVSAESLTGQVPRR